ncbi:hypothetical protein ACFUPZ_18615 [Microbacterium oxydans]|uniref:hypothetical protein n=1 Tax=Microbacterium oxydans TaxID=82380 RepID=UPI0036430717
MTRADKYPDQAQAETDRLQREANVANDAREEAEAREERLVDEIDTAFEAGDEAKVAALQAQHQQAEIDIENTTADFESAMAQVSTSYNFWYVEDEDDDEEADED